MSVDCTFAQSKWVLKGKGRKYDFNKYTIEINKYVYRCEIYTQEIIQNYHHYG